jgi:2-haloacid dehalogenase
VPAALEALSGRPLAILSNGTPHMLREAARNAGMEGSFTDILSADGVSIYKPALQVYQLAVDRFQAASRAEIGFVSSNAWDAAGATAFGFTTFWIDRGPTPGRMEELGVRPTEVIRGLDELAGLLA